MTMISNTTYISLRGNRISLPKVRTGWLDHGQVSHFEKQAFSERFCQKTISFVHTIIYDLTDLARYKCSFNLKLPL